jgi:signal transduction histidine kinase
VSGNDDIGELARTFNTMASDLELARQQHRQLTADVAHELRTPLTNIQGYLEGIKDRVVNPDAEIIETLHSQTIHLAKLVEDLRVLAIADAGALVLDKIHGSVIPVIEDVVAIFTQRAREKQIEISIHKTGTDPILDFDETRMRQIGTNLIENALTYTPNNGTVKVEVRGSSEKFILSVSDSGTGIPEDDLPRIFDQFFRTDRSRNRATGGVGLGLTIVKRLVESHGGFVGVTSKPGEGATFIITLPVQQS